MQIRAGIAATVAVEAHSKASNILAPDWVLDYAMDPIFNRPLGFDPHALAALEMNLFLNESGIGFDHCAEVVVKNRANALANPVAAYPLDMTSTSVNSSPYFAYPLRPGITFTYLGVTVNEQARVIMQDERPAKNIFAAGEVMAGNILRKGYLAGFGLTIGSVFGRIAGREAARHARG